jgi:signal transduction histidine kinase
LENKKRTYTLLTAMIVVLGAAGAYAAIRLLTATHEIEQITEIRVEMLSCRRYEKDFLSRRDTAYVAKHAGAIKRLRAAIRDLDAETASTLLPLASGYRSAFQTIVQSTIEVGLTPEQGLLDALRSSGQALEETLDSRTPTAVTIPLLRCRQYERDFLIRSDTVSVARFGDTVKELQSAADTRNAGLSESITRYRDDFSNLVSARAHIGLGPDVGLRGEMRSAIHKLETNIVGLSERSESDRSIILVLTGGLAALLAMVLITCLTLVAKLSRSNAELNNEALRRHEVEDELAKSKESLEHRVEERTAELEEATETADRARDFLVDAIESIDSAFVMYDKDEHLVITNQKYRDMNEDIVDALRPGMPREEILKAMYRARVSDDIPEEEWLSERTKGFRKRRVGHLRQLGSMWALMSSYPTADGGTVTIIADVTELQTARETTEKARDEAEQAAQTAEAANKAKSAFLANISHEIRTPLNAIQGFSEILEQRIQDPQLLEYLESIGGSSRALLALINDILDLARTESGDLELTHRATSTVKLFNDLEDAFRSRAESKGLGFRIDLDPGLPQKIMTDEKRLYQVLTNMVDNAVKFTQAGHVSISARSVPSEVAPEYADFSIDINDTGIGIPEEEVESIFGAFNQRSGQSINEYGGTGLGLALAHRLVEMLGGRINLKSEPGVGSTFQIVLGHVEIVGTDTLGDAESSLEQGGGTVEYVESWTPADLSDDARRKLPDLVAFMQSHLDLCEELSRTLTINEIDQFAGLMKEKGEAHEYPPLKAWGTRLGRQADAFEMDGLAESLELYPKLVEATHGLLV